MAWSDSGRLSDESGIGNLHGDHAIYVYVKYALASSLQ